MTKKEYLELLQRCARDGTFPGWDRETERCCYRSSDGHKCAIGCAIPDEAYDPLDEKTPTIQLIEKKYYTYLPGDMTPQELHSIQEIHDHFAERAFCNEQTWDAEGFIKRVRQLISFADVLKEVPL